MKHSLKLLLLLLISLSFAQAHAQKDTPELTEMYVFRGYGYSISFPEDWYAANDAGRIYLTNDLYNFDFDFYVPEMQAERGYPQGNPEELSELLFYAGDPSIRVDFEVMQPRTVDGETVYEYAFSNVRENGSQYPTIYYTRLMEDGTFIVGFLYPISGNAPVPPTLQDLGAAITAHFASNIVFEPAEAGAPFGFEKKYTFPVGYAVYFPEHWDAFLDEEGIVILHTSNTTLEFDFYYPELLAERSLPTNDLIAAAQAAFSPFDDTVVFDPKVITTLMAADRKVISFDFLENGEFPITYFALYQPDGTLVIGYLFPTFGSDPVPVEDRDTALQILASVSPVTE